MLETTSIETKLSELELGDKIILGAGAACVLMIFIGSAAAALSMTVAFLATAGVIYLLYSGRHTHYGAKLWNKMMENPIVTDVVITIVFTILFGTGTSISLLGGFAAGVITSAILLVIRKFSPNNGIVEVPEKGVSSNSNINNKPEDVIDADYHYCESAA